jgi:hypothetical protein
MDQAPPMEKNMLSSVVSELTGLLLGVVFWVFVASIILVPLYLRYRDRGRLHETLRIAYEKGQPVPSELIDALKSGVTPVRPWTPESDLRRGLVLVGVGLGLAGLGYGLWYGLSSVSSIAAYVSGGCVAGAGAIPGLIGVAYLILWATRRNAPRPQA